MPDGSVSRDPEFKDANATQYYGTVIPAPQNGSALPEFQLCAPPLCLQVPSA